MATGNLPDFNSLEVVQTGITSVSSSGATTNWTTVPHNLGFAPLPLAFLNNVNISSISSNPGNLPLPTWSSLGISGGNVNFQTWINAFADNTNLYIILFNATGGAVSALQVKYLLMQERIT